MDDSEQFKVMAQVMEVFTENNCSVEDIEEIMANIMPVIKRCSTLQNQTKSYFETITNMFNYERNYEHLP